MSNYMLTLLCLDFKGKTFGKNVSSSSNDFVVNPVTDYMQKNSLHRVATTSYNVHDVNT